MSPRTGDRTLWKTAPKALGLAMLVLALVAITGFVLASPAVRSSGFGKRMERRHPVRWAQLALVCGAERERLRAVQALLRTGGPKVLPALEQAAHDRSPRVRDSAVYAVLPLVPVAGGDAERSLTSLCRDRNPDLRWRAYRALRLAATHQGTRLTADVQHALVGGLQDPDLQCRWQAAFTTACLKRLGHRLPPEVAAALRRGLRGPSPGIHSLPPEVLLPRVERADAFSEFARQIEHVAYGYGDTHLLLLLWEADTPQARRLMQEHLATHSLMEAPVE